MHLLHDYTWCFNFWLPIVSVEGTQFNKKKIHFNIFIKITRTKNKQNFKRLKNIRNNFI
jgi:hypothetical protein